MDQIAAIIGEFTLIELFVVFQILIIIFLVIIIKKFYITLLYMYLFKYPNV